MQHINSTLQYSETALAQRGSADVSRSGETKTYETFKFPYTPKARERKLVIAAREQQQRTPESIRKEHIDSAVENALSQYNQKQKVEAQPQLTADQISAWAQWVLHADQNLEAMRQIETGDRSGHELAA